MAESPSIEPSPLKRGYKYRVKQPSKGVRITVYGDAVDEIVADYIHLRMRLEEEGVKVSLEEIEADSN